MKPMFFLRPASAALLAAVLLCPVIPADEGMWTFDNPPLKQLKEKYNFTPTQKWLDHLRLSSVRLNDGGSGSFVSPHGLLLTNHHVALGQLQKNSSADHDYVRDGFYAATPEEEMKSPDLEVNVLVSTENVTERVNAAVKGAKSPEEEFAKRKAVIADIERESTDKTGLRSDVVTLYAGGEYWLYRIKSTLMCAWYLPWSNRRRFTVAIRTISRIRDTTWTWRCSVCMRMASPSTARTI